MKTSIKLAFVLFILLFLSCNTETTQVENDFKFAFLTDIHVQPERNAINGFKQSIDTVNKLNPDFVITGGDLIMDALEQNFERSDSLYKIYNKVSELFKMPVYNTLGNHEIFGWFNVNEIDTLHEEYGKKMYEKRTGRKRYYAFNYGGWRFYIFDSVHQKDNSQYYGHVDTEQMEWLQEDLKHIGKSVPIAISTHIPLATVWTQLEYGAEQANFPGVVITNAKEVLELFKDHNLKLVLQGHLHFYENIEAKGIHFITAGAVSSKWWNGKNNGLEEGFLMVYVNGEEFEVDYIDYGWEAE